MTASKKQTEAKAEALGIKTEVSSEHFQAKAKRRTKQWHELDILQKRRRLKDVVCNHVGQLCGEKGVSTIATELWDRRCEELNSEIAEHNLTADPDETIQPLELDWTPALDD